MSFNLLGMTFSVKQAKTDASDWFSGRHAQRDNFYEQSKDQAIRLWLIGR
jgi:hypothetical protein